jgi:hypothetical protein
MQGSATDVSLEDFTPARVSCEILAATQQLSLPPGSILSLVADAS